MDHVQCSKEFQVRELGTIGNSKQLTKFRWPKSNKNQMERWTTKRYIDNTFPIAFWSIRISKYKKKQLFIVLIFGWIIVVALLHRDINNIKDNNQIK